LPKQYRVVQWASGSIGQISIRHFVDNPSFDLVGVVVTTPEKDGKDAGELAGIQPCGVAATTDTPTALAAGADCVHYTPLVPDLDTVCEILRSGVNVVTPTGYVYGIPSKAADLNKLDAACKEGNSTFHGTGIHPGFAGDVLALTLSRLSSRIDRIEVRETADFSMHPSAQMMGYLGFGADPAEAAAKNSPILEMKKTAFEPSIRMLADGLGVAIDRITMDSEIAVAKSDLEVRWGTVPKGTVGGMKFAWDAWAGDAPVIAFRTVWKVNDDLEPDWGVGGPINYRLLVVGDPPIELTLRPALNHPQGDNGYWGRVWTAMNGINAIRAVCEAAPGVATHLDLGVVQPRGLVRSRSDGFGEPLPV
jgi:2,4-diaminopentanoate dehydrogenase